MDPIDLCISHEGGYSNRTADKGGPTNFGVTQAVLQEWRGCPCSIADVKSLTVEEARRIYEQKYLRGPHIDQLPDPPQTHVLDMSINHGPKNAVKMLQRVINSAGFGPVDTDGALGPKSVAACMAAQLAMGGYFDNALVDERLAFYEAIVARDPSQSVFIKGWRSRAESFRVPV